MTYTMNDADAQAILLVAKGHLSPDTGERFSERYEQALAHVSKSLSEFEQAKRVIAQANNSLYGSFGYFIAVGNHPPNEHHLSIPIEDLKARVRNNHVASQQGVSVVSVPLDEVQQNVEARLKRIVQEHLSVLPDDIKEDSKFVDDLGADSLDEIELIMAVEEEFELDIPDSEAEELVTFGQFRDYLLAALNHKD